MSTTAEQHQRRLARNITLLNIHNVLIGLVFVLPVLVPFYQDRGLGFREFMIGEAVFSAIVILMEVPSGWLSDVWRRRLVLALAAVTHVIGWTTLMLAETFLMTVIAQGILGIGVSLVSGTNSALLYDSLQELGREDEYRRREGKRHAVGLYAVAGAAVAGGALYQIAPNLPIALTIVACVAAFVVALLMVEPGRHRVAAHSNPFADMARTFVYAVHGHREIAGIIILSAVLFAGTKMLMWAQQPYYIMLGMPEIWFGVFAAIGFFLGGLGGHFGHLVDGRLGNIGALLVFMAAMIAFCATAALWPGYHAIPLLLAGSMIFGFGWPRVQAAINNRVDGSRRATILSAASLTVHIVAIPLFVLMGWADEHAGITVTLLILAGVIAAGGLVGMALIRRINRRAVA